jgi:four helix bundle protein
MGDRANGRESELARKAMGSWPTYEEWQGQVHERVTKEPTWQNLGYRKALFLYDLAWRDCEKMTRDRRGRAIAEQLIRSVGSVSANIEEGHGRGYGKQRDWFVTVSMGSARETKGWYWRARQLLAQNVLEHRLALVDEVIALLVSELNRQRSRRTS